MVGVESTLPAWAWVVIGASMIVGGIALIFVLPQPWKAMFAGVVALGGFPLALAIRRSNQRS